MAESDKLRSALQRLVGGVAGVPRLDSLPAVGARPGGVSSGRPGGSARDGAGDLIESATEPREYHPAVSLTSSDGLFVIEVEPIKTVTFEDGRVLELQPPAPAEEGGEE